MSLDDAAAAAGALNRMPFVGAVAVAVDEADVADAADSSLPDGADAVAWATLAAEVGDVLGGAIHFEPSSVAAGFDCRTRHHRHRRKQSWTDEWATKIGV